MPPAPSAAPMTAEELLHLALPNARAELVRGKLVVREPAGYQHGHVAATALIVLGTYVRARQLGRVFAAETGFTLSRAPDTVRAPDVAFVSTTRLLPTETRGFAPLAPALVLEVVSPDDRPGDVLEKVADWLRAGTSVVWIVDPARRTGQVYRTDGTIALLTATDEFDGETVLPGFRVGLASLLD